MDSAIPGEEMLAVAHGHIASRDWWVWLTDDDGVATKVRHTLTLGAVVGLCDPDEVRWWSGDFLLPSGVKVRVHYTAARKSAMTEPVARDLAGVRDGGDTDGGVDLFIVSRDREPLVTVAHNLFHGTCQPVARARRGCN